MTVAIIAEFNPPHTGHAHLISAVREHFGEDVCVLVLLSGNYVQRADFAIVDSYTRGAGALAIGADLVLELPFPWSCGTAQIYAESAIRTLDALSAVDYIAFGSESGDLSLLSSIASYLSSSSFYGDAERMRHTEPTKSYAQIRTALIAKHFSQEAAVISSQPNNILALEYLLALSRLGSRILPYTIQRLGSYHSITNEKNAFPSSSAIREQIVQNLISEIEPYLSAEFYSLLQISLANGTAPAQMSRISSAIISDLRRRARKEDFSQYFEVDRGFSYQMKAALDRCADFPEFISLLKTKHLTDAHIRRAVLYTYFGVTSSEMHSSPAFTRVLAADSRGRERLKYIKQHSTYPVFSCPSDMFRLHDESLRQAAERADFADSLYFLSVPTPQPVEKLYGFRPFIAE